MSGSTALRRNVCVHARKFFSRSVHRSLLHKRFTQGSPAQRPEASNVQLPVEILPEEASHCPAGGETVAGTVATVPNVHKRASAGDGIGSMPRE